MLSAFSAKVFCRYRISEVKNGNITNACDVYRAISNVVLCHVRKETTARTSNLLDSMKPGDSVVTIGGLHGVVSEIDNDKRTVVLDCEGIFLEYDRAAIKTVKPGTVVTNDATTTVETTEEPAETVEVN